MLWDRPSPRSSGPDAELIRRKLSALEHSLALAERLAADRLAALNDALGLADGEAEDEAEARAQNARLMRLLEQRDASLRSALADAGEAADAARLEALRAHRAEHALHESEARVVALAAELAASKEGAAIGEEVSAMEAAKLMAEAREREEEARLLREVLREEIEGTRRRMAEMQVSVEGTDEEARRLVAQSSQLVASLEEEVAVLNAQLVDVQRLLTLKEHECAQLMAAEVGVLHAQLRECSRLLALKEQQCARLLAEKDELEDEAVRPGHAYTTP